VLGSGCSIEQILQLALVRAAGEQLTHAGLSLGYRVEH